jgi:hypothetical protein
MATNFFGVYRARITNTMDPTGGGRVQVTIPAVTDGNSVWAPVVNGIGHAVAGHLIGANVWVAFEAGDPSYPVVLGTSS